MPDMNSSCSCGLSCDGRDEPVSDGLAVAVPAPERQDIFTPGPFGRWALFLANASRARLEQTGTNEVLDRFPISTTDL